MSLKIIDKNIRSITGNIAKLNGLIHDTGMLIMRHANDHGDCTRALVLVKAMPASFRRGLLVGWFERNSPIRMNLTNDKVGMLKAEAKGYTPFNLEAAAAVPFYVEASTKAPGEAKQYDTEAFDKAFDSFISRMNKQIKDGNVPEGDLAAIEARINVLAAYLKVTDASKATVEFVLPKGAVSKLNVQPIVVPAANAA
jgi:hypothetical protein